MKGQYRVSVKENVATKVISTNSRWKYLSIFSWRTNRSDYRGLFPKRAGLGSMYQTHPIELITENVALCK